MMMMMMTYNNTKQYHVALTVRRIVREKGRIEERGFHSVRSEEPELEPEGSIQCTPHPHIQHLGTGPKKKCRRENGKFK